MPTTKTEYTYDGLNQLIQTSHINLGTKQSVDEFFTYDKAGNRIQRSILNAGEVQTDCYSYGLLNELNSITQKESNQSTNFSYDTDGNMRSNGRGIYCYDEYQQMTEARIEDGNKLVCRYDAEGLRYEMEENENLIQFIYSGRDVIYEESEQASSVRTIRGNGRIIASDVEHARTYYHYASDDLGSITHLICMNEESVKESTNVDSSRIAACYDYDAFGNRIYEGEAVSNRYGFTGEIYDRISGQYYLRARYYCQEIGRFTQPDSYHGDGLNLYAYVGNNPVRYVDPSGHTKCGKENGVEGGNGSVKSPEYDGETTHGVLVLDDGTQISFTSGNGDPRYTNYANNGHVEQKASLYMRESDISSATLYHNNTNGTCGFCNNMTPTFLPEGASLTVIPPANAIPNNSRAVAVPKTYIRNEKIPKISTKHKGD